MVERRNLGSTDGRLEKRAVAATADSECVEIVMRPGHSRATLAAASCAAGRLPNAAIVQ
jgi:hypothetical protein